MYTSKKAIIDDVYITKTVSYLLRRLPIQGDAVVGRHVEVFLDRLCANNAGVTVRSAVDNLYSPRGATCKEDWIQEGCDRTNKWTKECSVSKPFFIRSLAWYTSSQGYKLVILQ